MPNFLQDGHTEINDEFDNAHDLKEIRTELRRKGGTKIKTAVDNGYEHLEEDDWVQLDDYDGNIAKVKEVWDVKNDAWIIVQLADGAYERVDPYTVTKASNKMTKHWGDQKVEYQGGEWWVIGNSVKDGKTWVHLKDDDYRDNIMLEHTYRIVAGHDPVLTHPFYMPLKPHYAMDEKVWFLNDLYTEDGEQVGDFVNVEDNLEHMQAALHYAKNHKIHNVDVMKAVHEYHTVNTCRRRLPAEGMVPVRKKRKRSRSVDVKPVLQLPPPAQRPTYAQLVARHENMYKQGSTAWDFSVMMQVSAMSPEEFHKQKQLPFGVAYTYLTTTSQGENAANFNGMVQDTEWKSLGMKVDRSIRDDAHAAPIWKSQMTMGEWRRRYPETLREAITTLSFLLSTDGDEVLQKMGGDRSGLKAKWKTFPGLFTVGDEGTQLLGAMQRDWSNYRQAIFGTYRTGNCVPYFRHLLLQDIGDDKKRFTTLKYPINDDGSQAAFVRPEFCPINLHSGNRIEGLPYYNAFWFQMAARTPPFAPFQQLKPICRRIINGLKSGEKEVREKGQKVIRDRVDLGFFPSNALLSQDVRLRMAFHVEILENNDAHWIEHPRSFLNSVPGEVEMAWRRFAHMCNLSIMLDDIRIDAKTIAIYSSTHLENFCGILYYMLANNILTVKDGRKGRARAQNSLTQARSLLKEDKKMTCYAYLSHYWMKEPVSQANPMDFASEFELLWQLETLDHNEIARIDLYFWIVAQGYHTGNTHTGAADLDAFDVVSLEHEMDDGIFRNTLDVSEVEERTVTRFEDGLNQMEAAQKKNPAYREGHPETGAPPIFDSIYNVCPAGRPLLSYAYTFMRWLYYGMVAEGYYRSEGSLVQGARAFVDAHNQWKHWSPVNRNMPYPDAMHSEQNQHAVKSQISDPQTIDALLARRGPDFIMEPRPNPPISDEKEEPTEEKEQEVNDAERARLPSLEPSRSRSETRGGAFGSGSPSGFVGSGSPVPMPDQACELPPGEQKVPDHISMSATAHRSFHPSQTGSDSEDEDIIAVEEEDPDVPGETRTVHYAVAREPVLKQKYSNTTFFIFGAILVGLAIMTDER